LRLRDFAKSARKALSMRGCCRATPWGVFGPEWFLKYAKLKENELAPGKLSGVGKGEEKTRQ